MHKGMNERKDQEEKETALNNHEETLSPPGINRGFELLLRNKKRRNPPKTFQIKFGKMVSLFRREFHLYLDFHLDIRKQEN